MTQREGGYTILEVMIFLAISSLMFVGAATAIGGRQQEVQYSQSVRDLEGQLQDVLNDVGAGYYPYDSNYRCVVSPSGTEINFEPSNANEMQGSSNECVNVGKIIMFRPNGNDSVFSLGTFVGKRNPIGSASLDSAQSSLPTMAYEQGGIDLTTDKAVRYGIEITKIYNLKTKADYSSIIVASSFNTGGNSPAKFGQMNSGLAGVQDTSLFATTTGKIGDSVASFKPIVDKFLSINVVKVDSGLGVCLYYPANKRKALLLVGEGGDARRVTSQLDYTGGDCN